MTEEQQAQHDSEYKQLLALYITLLTSLYNNNEQEALYALSELRTDLTFRHVVQGLGIELNFALQLLKTTDESILSEQDRDVRARLVAAIDNLINFSVCEEYQLYDETLDLANGDEIDFNSDDYEDFVALCEKYNDTYAAIENSDIEYAGIIAAFWLKLSVHDYLVYWTQNDTHVRPWHMALQGYTAPRDEFPSWMIPPIEYNCRCFLETVEASSTISKLHHLKNSTKTIEKPQQLSDVYSESLAKCGRIFGPSHSYFSVKETDREMLKSFVERLRSKYYGQA